MQTTLCEIQDFESTLETLSPRSINSQFQSPTLIGLIGCKTLAECGLIQG